MPRKLIKRYLPDHHKIREHKHLKCFGALLHDPNLWHLNRRSVSGGFFVGLLCVWIPAPFQMLIAAAIAIVARVNLPISVALVWISNPFTMPPMFYFAYKLGSWILGTPVHDITFELSFDWLMDELEHIWEPFLLGCLIMGLASAMVGYLAVRIIWRLHIFQYLKRRRLRRKQRKQGA
jgi:uncharacterized protein (DUF2062 family)